MLVQWGVASELNGCWRSWTRPAVLNHWRCEVVTREELIALLWPKGVVDFDTGLNSAVRKLRVALRDEADTPRYIETVPRKGYRFIGSIDPPVADANPPVEVASVAADDIPRPSLAAPPRGRRKGESSAGRFHRRLIHRPLIYVALGAAATRSDGGAIHLVNVCRAH